MQQCKEKLKTMDAKFVKGYKGDTKKMWIHTFLYSLPVSVVNEHQFASPRKFRFDWAIPDFKIGIEYEGIVSGKSRHTTITGYTNDCEKYNLAVKNGWRVLRYTVMNYKDLEKDITDIFDQNKSR